MVKCPKGGFSGSEIRGRIIDGLDKQGTTYGSNPAAQIVPLGKMGNINGQYYGTKEMK